MKNLKLLQCKPTRKIPNCSNGCLTNDIDTGTVYVVTSTHFIGFLPETENVLVNIDLVSVGFVPDNDVRIIGAQHLPELEAVCFATASGDVNLYNTSVGQLECVGSVDSGLTCMSWSPDQETVTFTTGEETIIIMNKDFDPVTEVAMNSEAVALDTPVNVGWGKKETQFHGSLGKEAAKNNKAELGTEIVDDDDRIPRISWRGDGQFFVVSSIANQGVRTLRIWSREGCLVSTGESVTGLGSSLNWRVRYIPLNRLDTASSQLNVATGPSGNLIASTQRFGDTPQVIFFEKNGLRHGEFPLRFNQEKVKVVRLMWNIDSTVLALWLEDIVGNKSSEEDCLPSHHFVQLWYSSNYHWFLKQQLDFSIVSSDDVINDICWDSEFPLKLHVLTKGGCYVSYSFCWEITQSPGHSSENNATVVMIDGDNLLSTPMSSFVIPPPMSAHCLKTRCSINQVVFHPLCRNMAVLLSDGTLALIKNTPEKTGDDDDADRKTTPTILQARVNLNVNDKLWTGPGNLYQLTWCKENELVAIGRNVDDGGNVICNIKLTENDGDYEATVKSTAAVEKDVLRLFMNVDTGTLAMECSDGTMLRYISELDKVEIVPWTTKGGHLLTMPHPCSRLETVAIGDEEVVVGLTEHSRLYMNEKEVANNCSSFFIHDEYLLITTTAHTLRSLSLLPDQKGLASLLDDQEVHEHTRNVERGSKIITAVTQDSKLVLQMPRGNLEAIYPRVLVLSYLKKCLDSLMYKESFVCMRRHRINVNLICDHNPKLFLDNVETFIRQVESVTFINMFLSELREEDITKKLYSDHYRDRDSLEHFKTVSKVNAICNAVRLALESIDQNKYLHCVLTTYVKKTTPELEAALNIVKGLKDDNDVTVAADALKYILFLVDVNRMYDVALGMYDFQLVLMVAEKSQKDPKEYLPFLNNLRKMEENYQKYSIDKHLKRYSKAVQHLAKCGPEMFNECLELIKEQNLYTEALRLYAETTQEHKTIAECYGDHLVKNKKYDEAGLVFARCECYERALEAYQKSGNWRQVFCMAARLSLPEEKRLELARTVSGYLKEHGRHSEAAVVLLDYTNDYEEAIEVLIHGHLWEESLRLMYKCDRTDIIETHQKPALLEAFEQVSSSLETNRIQFEKYKSRLKVVREEKEKKRMEFLECELTEDPAADLFSETSSMTGQSTVTTSSLSSRTSGRSSKSRKKIKRKRVSLKEGSHFEEFALMEELSKTILAVDKMQEEVATLLKMLVFFGYSENARKLQVQFHDTLQLVQGSVLEIWPTKLEEETQTAFGPGSTANTITAAMKGNETIQNKDTPVAPSAPVMRKGLGWRLDQLKL